MSVAVLYKSKYGNSKRYAQWISEELGADLFEITDKVTVESLQKYDTLIFGGGIIGSAFKSYDVEGSFFLKMIYHDVKDKNLIVFTTGITKVDDYNRFTPILTKVFTKEIIDTLKFYHFRGKMDLKALTFWDRFNMKQVRNFVVNKKDRDGDDELLLDAIDGLVDNTSKDFIKPLIEYVNSL